MASTFRSFTCARMLCPALSRGCGLCHAKSAISPFYVTFSVGIDMKRCRERFGLSNDELQNRPLHHRHSNGLRPPGDPFGLRHWTRHFAGSGGCYSELAGGKPASLCASLVCRATRAQRRQSATFAGNRLDRGRCDLSPTVFAMSWADGAIGQYVRQVVLSTSTAVTRGITGIHRFPTLLDYQAWNKEHRDAGMGKYAFGRRDLADCYSLKELARSTSIR